MTAVTLYGQPVTHLPRGVTFTAVRLLDRESRCVAYVLTVGLEDSPSLTVVRDVPVGVAHDRRALAEVVDRMAEEVRRRAAERARTIRGPWYVRLLAVAWRDRPGRSVRAWWHTRRRGG